MKLVEGRKDSFIVIPGVRVISPQAFLILMREYKFFNLIDRYRIIQKKIDLIKIYLKLKKIVDDKETLKFELINHFRRALNISSDDLIFEVEFVEEMPLSKSGKLATIVSELTQYEKI
jgi:phenylacetate-coenzyme A ligase PaaK-like adenylate-forming protein